MEGESPWMGWREKAPEWDGRDMIRHPETFPEELKLLLSFLHGYLETMFALRILGNAERLLFILC